MRFWREHFNRRKYPLRSEAVFQVQRNGPIGELSTIITIAPPSVDNPLWYIAKADDKESGGDVEVEVHVCYINFANQRTC